MGLCAVYSLAVALCAPSTAAVRLRASQVVPTSVAHVLGGVGVVPKSVDHAPQGSGGAVPADVGQALQGLGGGNAIRASQQQRLEAEFARVSQITRDMAEGAGAELVTSDVDSRFLAPGVEGRHFLQGLRVVHEGKGHLSFRILPDGMLDQTTPTDAMVWEGAKLLAALHLAFLQDAIARYPDTPPFDVTFDTSDYCRDRDTGRAHFVFQGGGQELRQDPALVGSAKWRLGGGGAPLFAWNARPECNVIAAPSGYDWWFQMQDFTQGSPWRADSFPPVPWEQRKRVLLWRGGMLSWDQSRPRGLRLGLLHPDIFDIKVPWSGHQQLTTMDEVCAAYKRSISDAKLSFVKGATFGSTECAAVMGDFVNQQQQLGYRYVLDMDGAGSTFRVKNALLSGSLLFRVESGASQFFFPDLVPYVHYVPVPLEDLEDELPRKVRWAMEHDSEAKQIAANARNFAENHLRVEDAQWYLTRALRLYAGRMDFNVTVPEGFTPFCCEDAFTKWLPKEGTPYAMGPHCPSGRGGPRCAAPHQTWFSRTIVATTPQGFTATEAPGRPLVATTPRPVASPSSVR